MFGASFVKDPVLDCCNLQEYIVLITCIKEINIHFVVQVLLKLEQTVPKIIDYCLCIVCLLTALSEGDCSYLVVNICLN